VSHAAATSTKPPFLSVVVVVYDMNREAPRTLHTLSAAYQRGLASEDYEVLVVDNGSPTPLGESSVRVFGPNFRYHHVVQASSSPVAAINTGVSMTGGEVVAVMIDGARMVTPGLLDYARRAFGLYPDPVVTCPAWHLGSKPQQLSVGEGYDEAQEDALLSGINWRQDGYRLFEIGALAGSSKNGCFLPMTESNAIFLRRESMEALGGYDSAFDLPGGGMVNLDFYRRACERPGVDLVVLFGEGSFHQLHGGISTNVPREETRRRVAIWRAQYEAVRGEVYRPPKLRPVFLGHLHPAALPFIQFSAARRREVSGNSG
jgi:glycosyltransferase involved in cell wall biosynthesis